ncbi:MAG: FAD-dependent monooxygenase [Rhizobiales bacterium]|nr:FAD-dependent monooxygenase [Hyphomicrobiales bacterium]
MAPARHVIVAGAGIAGLTAALALARTGLRVTVLEQAAKLEETGAGLQLSPNASRVLIGLGLRERLAPLVMAPQAIRVMAGGMGREIVRIPLGEDAERRYGAPYWTIHRGDLQATLAAAARDVQDVVLKLGIRVEEFATHDNGISVQGRRGQHVVDERGIALIGADGIWSHIGEQLGRKGAPRFAHRTAWRALVPAEAVAPIFREPLVHLWLGLDAHLVHYPVKGGSLINIVAVVHDDWNETGWSAAGERPEILRHFAQWSWAESARALIALPERWLKWALFDRRTPFRKGVGPVTLIGDAAHPMLPFLAQGAGMAIEDGAVLAYMLGRYIDDPADALRGYEGARWHRTRLAQQAARRQARIYGKTGPEALIRNLAMRAMGGERLRARQDWLYTWQAPELVMHDPKKWTPDFGPDEA